MRSDNVRFYNPYNFIPATPRDTKHPELGDHEPPAHGWLDPELYTGVLKVRMTCKTPLILLDHLNVSVSTDGKKHKTYRVRKNPDCSPGLSPTAIKGMLSNAFEIVTNSRWRVFHQWDKPISFRKKVDDALSLVPARVKDDGSGIELLTNPNAKDLPRKNGDRLEPPHAEDGNGHGSHMYAAWLPMDNELRLPNHGEKVFFWTRRVQVDKTVNNKRIQYTYDRVVEWRRGKGMQPLSSGAYDKKPSNTDPKTGAVVLAGTDELVGYTIPEPDRRAHKVNGRVAGPFLGYACITKRSFMKKHDERIFFARPAPQTIAHGTVEYANIKESYEALVKDYQQVHESDDKAQREGPMRDVVWGRHVGFDGPRKNTSKQQELRKLKPGDLLYVKVVDNQPIAGYPAMISRQLFEESPLEALDDSLAPAGSLSEYSPAERVFGWVHSERAGSQDAAYKGNLRITNVRMSEGAGVVPGHLTLPILGSPKPSYVRFYCKGPGSSEVYSSSDSRDVAFTEGRGPRGRKVYPHQTDWRSPACAPPGSQNCTIEGLVGVKTVFEFDVHVKNLSRMELGALLGLLNLGDNHFLKLGYGKPLGFGSVTLELVEDQSKVALGSGWAEYFKEADALNPNTVVLDEISAGFWTEERRRLPYIAAFLRACQGFPHPQTRYPSCLRNDQPMTTDQYKWFVENEKPGKQKPLPRLQDNQQLEHYPEPERDQSGNRGGGNRRGRGSGHRQGGGRG